VLHLLEAHAPSLRPTTRRAPPARFYAQIAPHPLLKLASSVTFDAWPSLPCPECGEGALSATGELLTLKDPISEAFLRRVNAGLEAPDRLTGTCSGQLTCNNPKCQRAVLFSGDWIYDQ